MAHLKRVEVQYCSIMFEGFGGVSSIGPHICREARASQTAIRLTVVDFPAWHHAIDKRSIQISTLSNVGTFPLVYSSVSRTSILLDVNIDIAHGNNSCGPNQNSSK